ncbi:hypothetical protein DNTS_015833 [Danionella cerebrum]|uniref:Uncharacterized protein n=1 Tax=Danionella cerebrum TaxID=2873325 RepID=A0A553Q8K5_9TELE|nr:hypothetical protein DNTS_015833 [Danionella translucida]
MQSGLLKRSVGEGHVTCVHTVEFSTTRFVVRSASQPFPEQAVRQSFTRGEYTVYKCVYCTYRRLGFTFCTQFGSWASDIPAFVKVNEEKCQRKYSRIRCLRRAASVTRTGPVVIQKEGIEAL